MSQVTVQIVAQADDHSLPIFEEFENVLRQIEIRSLELYSSRGFSDGHALDDWLTAEREICWPAGELAESNADYVLSIALPGFDARDVLVTAAPDEIIVQAKATAHRKEEPAMEGSKVCWSELRSDDGFRRIKLDKEIDTFRVSASFTNGLLKIIAPKAERPELAMPVSVAA